MSLHLSILTSNLTFKTFFKRTIFTMFCFLGIISFINIFFDPYWIIWNKPLYSSSHLTLATKQRFSKGLQIVFRQPEIIVIGSSRVYRGFDFDDFSYQKKDIFYNGGISSLTITEALAYVKQVSRFTRVKHIILGLDLWMMDKNTLFHKGFNKHLGEFQDLLNSFFISIFSLESLKDSFEEFKSSFNPDKKKKGFWKKSGFFKTDPLTKKEIDLQLESYEKHLYPMKIDISEISILEKIIMICKEKNIQLSIYISPLHKKTFNIYQKMKFEKLFDDWIESITTLCEAQKIPFFNFSKDYFGESPNLMGSTRIWIDYSHFSPIVGNAILQKILEKSSSRIELAHSPEK